MPDCSGVPLIDIVLDNHDALTPNGSPDAVLIPVAPVVVCVIGVKSVLIQRVGKEEGAVTVLFEFTVMLRVADTFAQPPVPVIV